MSEAASAVHGGAAGSHGRVSVPWIVLTCLLVGVGLIGTAYWLLTFSWLMFLSLVPLSAGAILLFTRATGPEHA